MVAFLSIGKLAERTGVSISAIRFYEAEGLIHPLRNAGGQRRFLKADIRRLSFVRIAQQFGFSLDRIKVLLDELPQGRAPNEKDWARIGAEFREDLDARIETLERLRDNLDGCIGCGCLSMKKCALYNPDDQAATGGSGPRYLMGDRPA
ncbi:MAG: redox-sensitive transcriptional activator SoxR [Pseudomonadota bacterium]